MALLLLRRLERLALILACLALAAPITHAIGDRQLHRQDGKVWSRARAAATTEAHSLAKRFMEDQGQVCCLCRCPEKSGVVIASQR